MKRVIQLQRCTDSPRSPCSQARSLLAVAAAVPRPTENPVTDGRRRRPDLHRPGARDRRHPGVPHQLLGKRPRHRTVAATATTPAARRRSSRAPTT